MKILANIGLAIFLILTSALASIYFILLYEKIVRPQYKNMNTRETIYFGLLALVFVLLDVVIVRRFIRDLRGIKKS